MCAFCRSKWNHAEYLSVMPWLSKLTMTLICLLYTAKRYEAFILAFRSDYGDDSTSDTRKVQNWLKSRSKDVKWEVIGRRTAAMSRRINDPDMKETLKKKLEVADTWEFSLEKPVACDEMAHNKPRAKELARELAKVARDSILDKGIKKWKEDEECPNFDKVRRTSTVDWHIAADGVQWEKKELGVIKFNDCGWKKFKEKWQEIKGKSPEATLLTSYLRVEGGEAQKISQSKEVSTSKSKEKHYKPIINLNMIVSLDSLNEKQKSTIDKLGKLLSGALKERKNPQENLPTTGRSMQETGDAKLCPDASSFHAYVKIPLCEIFEEARKVTEGDVQGPERDTCKEADYVYCKRIITALAPGMGAMFQCIPARMSSGSQYIQIEDNDTEIHVGTTTSEGKDLLDPRNFSINSQSWAYPLAKLDRCDICMSRCCPLTFMHA